MDVVVGHKTFIRRVRKIAGSYFRLVHVFEWKT